MGRWFVNLTGGPKRLDLALSADELLAARHVVARVLDEIPARLVQATLFGSKARGDARPDSDIDILLVFSQLPPDREPQATEAEAIAEQVAEITAIPVTVWSVSLVDLEPGQRTPMLVDALADSIAIWCWPEPLPSIDFLPQDALRCCRTLLSRVSEGSEEFALARRAGDPATALKRARDDVVRLCTALLLLRGTTRPRRAAVIDECLRLGLIPSGSSNEGRLFDWVAASFGENGRCDEEPVPHPPLSERELTTSIQRLIDRVEVEVTAAESDPASWGTRRQDRV